jgi:hypothetical protein
MARDTRKNLTPRPLPPGSAAESSPLIGQQCQPWSDCSAHASKRLKVGDAADSAAHRGEPHERENEVMTIGQLHKRVMP